MPLPEDLAPTPVEGLAAVDADRGSNIQRP
jgi:hypothetical protein